MIIVTTELRLCLVAVCKPTPSGNHYISIADGLYLKPHQVD